MHKQQSRGELSRHTWHRQESDESSDSVPDEVRSEPNPHSRNFPRSHTFPTAVPSPSAIPTSVSAISSTNLGQEGALSQSSTQRRYSGPTTGHCLVIVLSMFHTTSYLSPYFPSVCCAAVQALCASELIAVFIFLFFRLSWYRDESSEVGSCANGRMGGGESGSSTTP